MMLLLYSSPNFGWLVTICKEGHSRLADASVSYHFPENYLKLRPYYTQPINLISMLSFSFGDLEEGKEGGTLTVYIWQKLGYAAKDYNRVQGGL